MNSPTWHQGDWYQTQRQSCGCSKPALSLGCAQHHAACRVGGKGLHSSWCIGLLCLHQDCWAIVCSAAGPLHLGDSRERKWASSSVLFLSGAEMATAQVAGGIWQLGWGRGIEHSPRDERKGPTSRREKNEQPVSPRHHHRWLDSSVSWFCCSLCYYFSISGYKCSNVAKLAILRGTVRTWPCQALHVLDRKVLNKIFQPASFLLNLCDSSACISQPLQCKIGKHLKEHKVSEKPAAS